MPETTVTEVAPDLFRICTMGDIRDEDLERLLGVCREIFRT